MITKPKLNPDLELGLSRKNKNGCNKIKHFHNYIIGLEKGVVVESSVLASKFMMLHCEVGGRLRAYNGEVLERLGKGRWRRI